MSTQVQLFNTPLTLVSIPPEKYNQYSNGILKLVLGTWREEFWLREIQKVAQTGTSALGMMSRRSSSHMEDNTNSVANTPSNPNSPSQIEDKCDALEEFINISVTPVEVSVICPTELLDILWEDLPLDKSQEEYFAIQVDGDGLNTGSRVLQISAPLSSAGIPIFFLATYFSDYVLVPVRAKQNMVKAIQDRGYAYSSTTGSYTLKPHQGDSRPYSEERVDQTFELLNSVNITPTVDISAKLLLTGSRSNDDSMMISIVKTLLRPPKYFSITMSNREISFIIDQTTAQSFPETALLGSPEEFVVPVLFDLSKLPENSTGIVSGVASKIMGHRTVQTDESRIHMSYVSTVNSALVLISEEDADDAMVALT